MNLRRRAWPSGRSAAAARSVAYAVHPAADEEDVRRLLGSMADRELLDLQVAARRPATPRIAGRLLRLQDLTTEELRRRVTVDLGATGRSVAR